MSRRAAAEQEAQRQHALLQAILFGSALPVGVVAPDGIADGAVRGLRAYRINAQALAARALAAVHGRLLELLGCEDFAAMAWAFWRRVPPQRGDLGEWGEGLADFLASQTEMPAHLPDLARLEWALHQAERAADAVFDAPSLARLASEDAGSLRLRLRPGSRLLQVDALAASLVDAGHVATGSVQVLVWRPQWRPCAVVLPAAPAVFTGYVLDGQPLQQALTATLQSHEDFAFDVWLQRAIEAGWLQGVSD